MLPPKAAKKEIVNLFLHELNNKAILAAYLSKKKTTNNCWPILEAFSLPDVDVKWNILRQLQLTI